MRDHETFVTWLYLVNAALLATHEIDSAYWHEWEMFRLPGGLRLFLVVNFVLLLAIFYGFGRVARLERGTKLFSYLLASAGLFAFAIHITFLATGHPEFHDPVSVGLLFATLLVSLLQFVFTARLEISASARTALSRDIDER